MSDAHMIRTGGRLAGDVLAGGVGLIEDVHRAIADRAFRGGGPAASSLRTAHDAVSEMVYTTVRGAHALAPRVGAALAALGARPDLGDRPASTNGEVVMAALNGLWGDTMARQYPDLALKLSLRHDGHEVSPDPAGLASAFPDASHKIAAFVHGLCETDASWRRNAQRHYGDPSTTYGSLLQRDLAYTPLYVVYNSGMHVSDNGRQLSAMMDEITTHWPVSVDEIALIGHSMGGLVARSACHYAHSEDRPWAASVAHVVCLGTPHLGAPLEKAVHTAAWLAGQLPETRPVAKLLNARSAGVKDLCFGACVEEDWRQCHPDELLRDRCTDVPFLPHATYYFVAASVTTDPAHPIGALIGDLLVRVPSASGRGRHRRIPFEIENGSQVGRFHHFDLLNHPAVYQELLGWFETARPRRAGAAR